MIIKINADYATVFEILLYFKNKQQPERLNKG